MNMTNIVVEKLQFAETSLNKTAKSGKASESFDNKYNEYKDKYDSAADDVKKNDTTVNSSVKENKLKGNRSVNKVKQPVNSQDNTQKKDELENQIKTQLAQKLGISEEEISLILEQLNITVFDLTDKTNLNNFIQKLLNIDSPVELLVSDKASQMYNDITEIVTQYESIIETIDLNAVTEVLPNSVDKKQQRLDEQEAITVSQNMDTTTVNNNTNQAINSEASDSSNTVQQSTNKVIEINDSTPSKKETSDKNQNSNSNETFSQQNLEVAPTFTYTDTTNMFTINNAPVVNEAINNITTMTSVNDVNNIINQVVEQIKVDIKPDVSEIKLILRPDTLGELSLRITTENNIVVAQFVAESQQVKEVLEANFNNLKDTLQQLGLIVDELSVSVGGQSSQAKQHFEQNKQKSARRIEQILEDINAIDATDNGDYLNPYQVTDNQVDYMA